MQLDREARQLLDLLEQAGYRAYAVGGCVRDACMGRAYADVDLCTSALPRQTETVLAAADIDRLTARYGYRGPKRQDL